MRGWCSVCRGTQQPCHSFDPKKGILGRRRCQRCNHARKDHVKLDAVDGARPVTKKLSRQPSDRNEVLFGPRRGPAQIVDEIEEEDDKERQLERTDSTETASRRSTDGIKEALETMSSEEEFRLLEVLRAEHEVAKGDLLLITEGARRALAENEQLRRNVRDLISQLKRREKAEVKSAEQIAAETERANMYKGNYEELLRVNREMLEFIKTYFVAFRSKYATTPEFKNTLSPRAAALLAPSSNSAGSSANSSPPSAVSPPTLSSSPSRRPSIPDPLPLALTTRTPVGPSALSGAANRQRDISANGAPNMPASTSPSEPVSPHELAKRLAMATKAAESLAKEAEQRDNASDMPTSPPTAALPAPPAAPPIRRAPSPASAMVTDNEEEALEQSFSESNVEEHQSGSGTDAGPSSGAEGTEQARPSAGGAAQAGASAAAAQAARKKKHRLSQRRRKKEMRKRVSLQATDNSAITNPSGGAAPAGIPPGEWGIVEIGNT